MQALVDSFGRPGSSRALRNISLLATALVVGLCTASSASAANLVPNPGFEVSCGTVTKACSWYEEAGGSVEVQRDLTIALAGSTASYKLHLLGPFLGASGFSVCMAPPSPVSASMSFWYRTSDSRVVDVSMIAWYWDTATCSSSASGSVVRTFSPITDGAWHQLSNTVSVPSGPPGFTLEVGFSCQSGCAGAQVNYDDLVFEQTPTAVRVASIHGLRTRSGVLLRWRTVQETAVLGFDVYRQEKGRLVKLNRALIPSVFGGTTAAHAYSWLDRSARTKQGALHYRLQAVSLDGSRSWVGTTSVA